MSRAAVARGGACLRRLRPAGGAQGAGRAADRERAGSVARAPGGDAGKQVLLVEDDAALASIVARHLVARGHEARVAPSATAVTRILGTGFVPSVVVVDLDLPDGEGWDLLSKGRLGGSGARVVTASTGVRGSRLRQLDVDWFVLKPFALAVLVEIVEGRGPADGASSPGRTRAMVAQPEEPR